MTYTTVEIDAADITVGRGPRGSGDMMHGKTTLRVEAGTTTVMIIGTPSELDAFLVRLAETKG